MSAAAADDSRAVGTDLPPGASRDGTDKGAVSLHLSQLVWSLRGAPPWCRVTVRWWGDQNADKKRRPWVRLNDGESDAEMTFPVKCKPSGFSRYCRDARAVVLEFSDGRTGRLIASASVDISQLDIHRPVGPRRLVRLASRAGGALGTVHVGATVDYHPGAVSSFELNEHLAKTHDDLPLAPPPSARAPHPSPRAAAAPASGDATTWWYKGPVTPQPPTPTTPSFLPSSSHRGRHRAGEGGGDGAAAAAAEAGGRRGGASAAFHARRRDVGDGLVAEKENVAAFSARQQQQQQRQQKQQQRQRQDQQRVPSGGGRGGKGGAATAAAAAGRNRAALATTPKPVAARRTQQQQRRLDEEKADAASVTPNGVLEYAERLRGEMDEALSYDAASAGAASAGRGSPLPRFDGGGGGGDGDDGRWWGDVGASGESSRHRAGRSIRRRRRGGDGNSLRGSAASAATTRSGLSDGDASSATRDSSAAVSELGEEEDDAAFAADEALLEELFFVDSDGEGAGFDRVAGPAHRRRRRGGGVEENGADEDEEDDEGEAGDVVRASVSARIGRLALEAEAELERDMAAAEAATSRIGLDGLSWRRYQRRADNGDGGGDGGDGDDGDDDDALELSESEDSGVGGAGKLRSGWGVRGALRTRRGGTVAGGNRLPIRNSFDTTAGGEGGETARRRGPELELRLTAHSGLIGGAAADARKDGAGGEGATASNDVVDVAGSGVTCPPPASLVAVIKAGFATGELGRVILDGPRACGSARVRLPPTAAAAAIMGHAVVVVLELWEPSAAADCPGFTGRASLDAGAEIFSQLFGDFESADPSVMRGVVAVPLADLCADLEAAEARAEAGDNGGDEEGEEGAGMGAAGSVTDGGGLHFPLNKVVEVRNPILSRSGGFLGVEGRVVLG